MGKTTKPPRKPPASVQRTLLEILSENRNDWISRAELHAEVEKRMGFDVTANTVTTYLCKFNQAGAIANEFGFNSGFGRFKGNQWTIWLLGQPRIAAAIEERRQRRTA